VTEHVDVLVIGAGQAGLGAGYWLARRTSAHVLIVDAAASVGQSWRDRWDSLKLFTPARFAGLPGMRFPGPRNHYPSKDDVARYLTRYAIRHDLPLRLNTRVDAVRQREGGGFDIATTHGSVVARHVVVAAGPFHGPVIPDAAQGLSRDVKQLHSSQYRRPTDLPTGHVLVVGGGNSAAQLACELSTTHLVTVASGAAPWYLPTRIGGLSLYWWMYFGKVLNAPADASVSRYVRERGDAIISRDLAGLVAQGRVRLVPSRVVAATGREVVLADGSRVSPDGVLWCTGFRPDYRWLQVPGAQGDEGEPLHTAGAAPVPGLHWLGLPWQTRLNSSIVDGVDRDARALAERILDADTDTDADPVGQRRTGTWDAHKDVARVMDYYDRHADRFDKEMDRGERLLFGAHRSWAVAQASARTLEIGVGTGLNLPLYAPQVTVTGIDVSPRMLARARTRPSTPGTAHELVIGDAELLAFADGSFDTALSTYTFCSIPNPEAAAREVLRVVRPGGRFVLVEHGRARGRVVRSGQLLLAPLFVRLHAEHIRRDPAGYLHRAGWEVLSVERSGRAGLVHKIVARKPDPIGTAPPAHNVRPAGRQASA